METIEFASVIRSGTELCGTIRCEQSLLIQGVLIGCIECSALLEIDSLARVKGNIQADSLYLKGCIEGSVEARSIYLAEGACITGTVLCDRIQLERNIRIEKGIRFKLNK